MTDIWSRMTATAMHLIVAELADIFVNVFLVLCYKNIVWTLSDQSRRGVLSILLRQRDVSLILYTTVQVQYQQCGSTAAVVVTLRTRASAKCPRRDPRQTERRFGCGWTRRNRQILRTPYPPLWAPSRSRSRSHLRPPLVFLSPPPPFLTQSCRFVNVVILLYRCIIIMYFFLQTHRLHRTRHRCYDDFWVVDLLRTGRARSNPPIAP